MFLCMLVCMIDVFAKEALNFDMAIKHIFAKADCEHSLRMKIRRSIFLRKKILRLRLKILR